jgi:hypothetical protein
MLFVIRHHLRLSEWGQLGGHRQAILTPACKGHSAFQRLELSMVDLTLVQGQWLMEVEPKKVLLIHSYTQAYNIVYVTSVRLLLSFSIGGETNEQYWEI